MAPRLSKHNDVEALLAEFLREAARKGMSWGRWDCGLWLADWVAAWRGIDDPAAALRGRYNSEASCHRLLGKTPFPVVVSRLARKAGLKATDEPGPGSVGILVGPAGPVGAIHTGRGWAVIAERGGLLRLGPDVRVLRAWSA